MDIEWLKDRDTDFFKNRYREYCAQLVLCQHAGFKALIADAQEKMTRLLSLGKISKKEADEIEVDVRASQAEVDQVWKNSPLSA